MAERSIRKRLVIADPAIVEAWASGWSLSRGAPAPERTKYGLRIDVGLPRQLARHILPIVERDALRELAESANAPWVFIKACAAPQVVRRSLPPVWTVQAPNFMMTREISSGQVRVACPGGYCASSVVHNGGVLTIEVLNGTDVAARGRLALHGRVGIFDQVVTDEAHRRRGLGTLVMGLLSESAARMGADKGVLVATEDGLKLYTSLGWVVHSPVTSAVVEGGAL